MVVLIITKTVPAQVVALITEARQALGQTVTTASWDRKPPHHQQQRILTPQPAQTVKPIMEEDPHTRQVQPRLMGIWKNNAVLIRKIQCLQKQQQLEQRKLLVQMRIMAAAAVAAAAAENKSRLQTHMLQPTGMEILRVQQPQHQEQVHHLL